VIAYRSDLEQVHRHKRLDTSKLSYSCTWRSSWENEPHVSMSLRNADAMAKGNARHVWANPVRSIGNFAQQWIFW